MYPFGRADLFRSPLLLLTALLSAGCCRHHCRNSCETGDRTRLGDRLHDRIEERQEGRRRDPGTAIDRAIPPDVIPPRGEYIAPTPLPVTPSRSNTNDWNSTAPFSAPSRSSQKLAPDLPPLSIPSDPVPIIPSDGSNRTLLLPDPLLVDPHAKPLPALPGIFGDPVLPVGSGEVPKSDSLKAILFPKTGLNFPSDLPRESDPVGVESFAAVPGQDRVASGRKPLLEGLDALKAKGFKTVLYLHAPDADVTAARETVEKSGLKFVALPVSPETLAAASKVFAERLKDAASKPLYVYDLDGIRAGSLWYLHFRTIDLLADEPARIRAGTLGLQAPSTSDERKGYWLAIQDLLAKR